MSKKEKILKEALKLFATQGVGNTSTAEITKKAGVAEGTLFLHFKNKQTLVDEVYRYIKIQEAEVFSKAVDDVRSAEEFVRTLSKTVVNHFVKNYNELIFLQNVRLLNLVSKDVVREVNKHFENIRERLVEWQVSGDIKQVDTDLLHKVTWAMIVALTRYCKQNKKKVTEKLIDPIWDAVRK